MTKARFIMRYKPTEDLLDAIEHTPTDTPQHKSYVREVARRRRKIADDCGSKQSE